MKKVNPFLEKQTISPDGNFREIKELSLVPYDKKTASPYTKTRMILMNGTEFESNWFLHQFSRHCNNNDLRREIANIRRHEQQQQKMISSLKPVDETDLETTIAYEQLAVDLTAILAQHVKDENVKSALNFALLEDFDHLYRFANLIEAEEGVDSSKLVGKYTEIMPGRPTIAEHRHPYDSINKFVCNMSADPFTKLAVNIITAAEQQTMNYYMNVSNLHTTETGKKLYAEIAMIEEQHVTEYGSLLDTNASWLENWVMHEYTECYLYYSCYADESDENIKKVYERLYYEECGHLQKAAELLEKYEGKHWTCLYPCGGDFPELLKFGENIEYIRDVLKNTINLTKHRECYIDVEKLDEDSDFKKYNGKVCKNPKGVPSHTVIENYVKKNGEDYRFQVKEHPIKELADRKNDNTTIAR